MTKVIAGQRFSSFNDNKILHIKLQSFA